MSNNGLARHRVRGRIEEMILTGQRQPGERLTQQELARQLGVAQSVVREALLELQVSGLVRAVDNLGVFVSELGVDDLLQACEIREVLEGLAARLCCQQASRGDVEELRQLANEIHSHGRLGRQSPMGAGDRQFHNRMILISRNAILQRLTEGYRMVGMLVRAERDINTVRDEHLAILDAIADDRPDDAEDLARRHVRASYQALAAKAADGSFSPQWIVDTAPQLEETGS